MIQFSKQNGCYRLVCETYLPAPRDQVFRFFSDVTQLEALTPAWLRFSVTTPTPIELREGSIIDYKLLVHGIPLKWRSLISCWKPPYQFADEQIRGPYRHWYHVHTFEGVGEGTLCRDEVEFAHVGGRLIYRLFVKSDLQKIFEFRTQVLQQIFNQRAAVLQSAALVTSSG